MLNKIYTYQFVKRFTILLIVILLSSNLQAMYFRRAACAITSIVSAYPMLKKAAMWSYFQRNRDALISTLNDVDPQVSDFVRKRLADQEYYIAEQLPIKVRDDFFSMETKLDNCLCFSKAYEAQIKDILEKEKESSLDEIDEIYLRDCIVNLDHEMFHIQDQHRKKLTRMQVVIPVTTELHTLLLIGRLAKKGNVTFAVGLLASILLKRKVNEGLEIIYSRWQEKKADEWALLRNYDVNNLNAVIEIRKNIPKWAVLGLILEHIELGRSRSIIFDVLIKLFDSSDISIDLQRFSTDSEYAEISKQKINNFYKKLKSQPFQWPLRLLSYEFDLNHPFVLDSVAMIKARIKEIEDTH